MNDNVKLILNELGFHIDEVIVKYDSAQLKQFGIVSESDSFIIKGSITDHDRERLDEILEKILELGLQD